MLSLYFTANTEKVKIDNIFIESAFYSIDIHKFRFPYDFLITTRI